MRKGDEFPPIAVAKVQGRLYVVDGFHRLAAARAAKRTTIAALVAAMTEKEAVITAIHANSTHGLRLTNSDKRRCLELFCGAGHHLRSNGTVKSSRRIAEELFRIVSHTKVALFLKEAQIEPGEAEDDGMFTGGSWRASESLEPLEEKDMIEDAATHLNSLRTLCEQMSDPASIAQVRADLGTLIERLDAELGSGGSYLDYDPAVRGAGHT
jgi:hypothetical protein